MNHTLINRIQTVLRICMLEGAYGLHIMNLEVASLSGEIGGYLRRGCHIDTTVGTPIFLKLVSMIQTNLEKCTSKNTLPPPF